MACDVPFFFGLSSWRGIDRDRDLKLETRLEDSGLSERPRDSIRPIAKDCTLLWWASHRETRYVVHALTHGRVRPLSLLSCVLCPES